MTYRPDEDSDFNIDAYWKRKQSVKENRVSGEAPLAKADRDCDAEENFSYGKSGYGRPKDKTTVNPFKSNTIWEDDAWKDKT